MKNLHYVNVNVVWDHQEIINGEWEVTFNTEFVIGGSINTFCSIRRKHGIPYAGSTIFNPHDRFDEKTGMWVAFRRALATYLLTKLPTTISKNAIRMIRRQFYTQIFGDTE